MKMWRERIVEARERKAAGARGFTIDDWCLAHDWGTCAVGEHRQVHPIVVRFDRHEANPVDRALATLGGYNGFALAVRLDDVDAAESFLDRIEDRVLTLKREATP